MNYLRYQSKERNGDGNKIGHMAVKESKSLYSHIFRRVKGNTLRERGFPTSDFASPVCMISREMLHARLSGEMFKARFSEETFEAMYRAMKMRNIRSHFSDLCLSAIGCRRSLLGVSCEHLRGFLLAVKLIGPSREQILGPSEAALIRTLDFALYSS